jgi:charged multivesicular body protein 4
MSLASRGHSLIFCENSLSRHFTLFISTTLLVVASFVTMMNFFGKKKSSEASTVSKTSTRAPSDPQQTIVTLREQVANQEKREAHIHKKVNEMVVEAKAKLAKGDKKGALFCMKRKKLYEQEIDKIQNVKMTLETQVINLESAAQNAQTFKAMEAGSKTMKKIRTDVGIEQVDDIMDEIKEEMEMANEINNAIAQPIDPLLADDDELLAELNELESTDLEAELLKPTPSISLPAVPNAKLPALAKDEEDELKKLEAELAG